MQDLNSIHSTISNTMLIHFQVLGYKLIHSLPSLLAEVTSKDLFSPVGISVRGLRNSFGEAGVGGNGVIEASMAGQSGQAVQRP